MCQRNFRGPANAQQVRQLCWMPRHKSHCPCDLRTALGINEMEEFGVQRFGGGVGNGPHGQEWDT